MSLRYSDVIYLLNILKLQRARHSETDDGQQKVPTITPEQAREQWIEDLTAALSVAANADAKYQKDSKLFAKVLYEKVEKMEGKADLGYEDFIGPLVVLSSLKNLIRAQDSNTE